MQFTRLAGIAALALLSACAHNDATPLLPLGTNSTRLAPQVATHNYKVLYAFKGAPDGAHPAADLVAYKGNPFGTTSGGGSGCYKNVDCGTVFELTPSGQEKVLYSFRGGTDGAHPFSKLLVVGGLLYGTTADGGRAGCGRNGCGTVFSVSLNGKERVLHAFAGGTDGAYPSAALVAFGNELYGTTQFGGGSPYCGCGTVFAYDPATGMERIVYAFRGGLDGAFPVAALIAVKGDLYGTTASGGYQVSPHQCGYYFGCGTVFRVSPRGSERVLFAFNPAPSNAYAGSPQAPLTHVNAAFYGATTEGGGRGTAQPGCGTIFSGDESQWHVLFAFGNPPGVCDIFSGNGAHGVLFLNGSIYGTLESPGELYELQLPSNFGVLHTFTGGADGASPAGGVIRGPNSLLYGTTLEGGGEACARQAGCGTVFAISP